MAEFLQTIFSFPTLVFTGLLALVLVYWLSAFIGLADWDSDIEADSELTMLPHWLNRFKWAGVPITLSLSFIILFSWVLSFLSVHFLYPHIPQPWLKVFIGLWLLVLIPVFLAELLQPFGKLLQPLFHKAPERSAVDLIGEYAKVRSGYVSSSFGEAELTHEGTSLILKIRATEPNTIQRNDLVRLVAYDATTSSYQITAQ